MKVIKILIKVIKMLSKFMNIALSSTIVAILSVAQNVNSSELKQETGDNLLIPYQTTIDGRPLKDLHLLTPFAYTKSELFAWWRDLTPDNQQYQDNLVRVLFNNLIEANLVNLSFYCKSTPVETWDNIEQRAVEDVRYAYLLARTNKIRQFPAVLQGLEKKAAENSVPALLMLGWLYSVHWRVSDETQEDFIFHKLKGFNYLFKATKVGPWANRTLFEVFEFQKDYQDRKRFSQSAHIQDSTITKEIAEILARLHPENFPVRYLHIGDIKLADLLEASASKTRLIHKHHRDPQSLKGRRSFYRAVKNCLENIRRSLGAVVQSPFLLVEICDQEICKNIYECSGLPVYTWAKLLLSPRVNTRPTEINNTIEEEVRVYERKGTDTTFGRFYITLNKACFSIGERFMAGMEALQHIILHYQERVNHLRKKIENKKKYFEEDKAYLDNAEYRESCSHISRKDLCEYTQVMEKMNAHLEQVYVQKLTKTEAKLTFLKQLKKDINTIFARTQAAKRARIIRHFPFPQFGPIEEIE